MRTFDGGEDDVWARGVFEQYAARLARAVEGMLAPRLKTRLDAEDITQSAFRSFFRRESAGEFAIDSSADLWKLLAAIARNKALQRIRAERSLKRDVGAEVSAARNDVELAAVADRVNPVDSIAICELIELAVQELDQRGEIRKIEILRLLMIGVRKKDICDQLETTYATIDRAIENIRNLFQHLSQERVD